MPLGKEALEMLLGDLLCFKNMLDLLFGVSLVC